MRDTSVSNTARARVPAPAAAFVQGPRAWPAAVTIRGRVELAKTFGGVAVLGRGVERVDCVDHCKSGMWWAVFGCDAPPALV